MNILKTDKRKAVVAALVEGNSIRATCRMTGVAKNTVTKLLRDLGDACSEYQHRAFRNLSCKRIQVDEIWAFVYAKAKNVPASMQLEMVGDVWTWVAIDADTKLVPTFMVGRRDAGEVGPSADRIVVDRLAVPLHHERCVIHRMDQHIARIGCQIVAGQRGSRGHANNMEVLPGLHTSRTVSVFERK